MARAKPTPDADDNPEAAPDSTEALMPEPISPEQIEDLKNRAARADENWDRLLRATADFDNYKKRSLREREEAVKYANESLLKKLVLVLDNFDMALAAAGQQQADGAESLQTGLTLIQQQLKSLLAEAGVEEVDATGKSFDPNLHEAVSQQESADVPEGHVLQQLRRGYKLRDRLIRPASVVVARKPAG